MNIPIIRYDVFAGEKLADSADRGLNAELVRVATVIYS